MTAFRFAEPRRARRPSLTPMIDVVFLLLVFFMLVARVGQTEALPIAAASAGSGWSGPPRLVAVTAEEVRLNGVPTEEAALMGALRPLMPAPDDPVLVRADAGADLQRLVDVMARLREAGIDRLVLVE